MFHVYRCYSPDGRRDTPLRLGTWSRNELLLLALLGPFCFSNMRADYDPRVYAADVSPFGLGVVSTEIGKSAVAELWRRAEVKGRVRTLLHPLSAMMKEAGNDDWEEMLAGEDVEQYRRAGRPTRGHRREVEEHWEVPWTGNSTNDLAMLRPGGGKDAALNDIERQSNSLCPWTRAGYVSFFFCFFVTLLRYAAASRDQQSGRAVWVLIFKPGAETWLGFPGRCCVSLVDLDMSECSMFPHYARAALHNYVIGSQTGVKVQQSSMGV